MSCRLILNADDFGWSEGANAAVADLYDRGIVTSTSLMVGGPAAAGAVGILRARPGLAVGLHLSLVDAVAVLPPAELPALVDADGRFPRDPVRMGLKYTLLPAARKQMRREAEAQFEAFAALGLPLSHVDTHVHMALTPAVFHTALQLARKYDAGGFRVPLDDFGLYRQLDSVDADRQKGMARAFRLLCKGRYAAVRAAGLRCPDRCFGFFRSGRLDREYLCRLVEKLPEGEFELHCHPDLATPEGEREYAALASDQVRDALRDRGLTLCTYASLAAPAIQ